MFVRQIETGATIESIIQGMSDGKENKYLVVDKPNNEMEKLAFFANKKIDEGYTSYLKVKYEWEFGQRARVLEVVTTKDDVVTIYKFVTQTNFDKHALDLERIRESILEKNLIPEQNLKICLVTTSRSQQERLKEMLAEMKINCNVETI